MLSTTAARAGLRRPPALAALAAGVALALSGCAPGCTDPPDCEQPYSPVDSRGFYPGTEPEIDAVPISESTSADRPFDSDGDGLDDGVDDGQAVGYRQVTILRGDGAVVLTAPPSSTLGVNGLGDIDRDGRDELQATAYHSDSGERTVYVVPGTTAPGTHAVSGAGIALGGPGWVRLALVGDGSGRLLRIETVSNFSSTARTDVLDAAAVLARGPGGSARGLTPDRSFVGEAAATADLGSPTDALVVVDNSMVGHDEVLVVDEGGDVRLTTAPEEYVQVYGPGVGGITVLDGPDGTFVSLFNGTRDRARSYYWSLDAPCDPLADGGSARAVAG